LNVDAVPAASLPVDLPPIDPRFFRHWV